MPSQRRSFRFIAAAGALVALVALAVIVPHHVASPSRDAAHPAPGVGTTPDGGASASGGASTPDGGLLAAQNLEYAPGLDPFDIDAFLRSIGSGLAEYVLERGEQRVSVGELVMAAAERHAVNPRVLLVLMELTTGVVSAPSPDLVMQAAGYPMSVAPDAEAQIERLAVTLASHYVAASMGDEAMAVKGPGDSPVHIDADDPAAAAIARTLAETLPLTELGAAVSGARPGFVDVYRQWFGDPQEMPAFARGVTLPTGAAWPYEGAKRHTGGPHLGAFCSQQDVLAASGLDFGGESHEVLAMADGRYLGRGETSASGYQAGKYVLLEHEGGVQVMFWHLGGFSPEVQALAPGAEIPKGFPVGWSGRSGNQSAVHLHVELRRGAVATNPYSGVRISWDGQVVDGWTVHMFRWPGRSDRGVSYRGSAVRGATRVLPIANCACDLVNADALVSTGHPGTSSPRNGMDADTVLANYPDVGLLPSTNTRTTALWATAEKTWVNHLPWYYLVDGSDGGVDNVSLDGAPLFTAPECARAVWLNAGEHRLAWRYRGAGAAGANMVRLVPWPFDAPACAASALDAPPSGETPPALPHDDAALVEEPDAVMAEPGARASVAWRVRNTGSTPWGDGCRLTFDDGWPLDTEEEVVVPAAAPGQEVTVTLPISVPPIDSVAHATWRLRNSDGVAFGPALTLAVSGVPSARPDATPEAAPGSPSDAPVLLEPVAADGAPAYLASHDVTLRWAGPLDATGYMLHVSLSAEPADDPAPVFREQIDAAVHERRLAFAADAPRLYWQVSALRAHGEARSPVGAFVLDTVAPTCKVAVAPDGAARASVTWHGDDSLSGVAGYDVAYRVEGEEAWRALVTGASAQVVEASLASPRGGTYTVRCRARDAARNVGAWSDEVEDATVVLGGPARAQVAGAGPAVTALPDERLFVEAPVRNVGPVAGDARLSLVLESGLGRPETVYRWDVVGLAPGAAVTLTAMIAAPNIPGVVGEPLDAGYRFSVQSRVGAGTELAAMTDVCLARPDPYEDHDAIDGGALSGAALAPGGRQTRGFHAPWDVDYARVTAERGRTYIVWTEGFDTVVVLYDAAGALVGQSAGAGGPTPRIVWTAPEDGVYHVRVRPWAPGSEGCGSGYILGLQSDPASPEVPEGAMEESDLRLPIIRRLEVP